MTDEMNGVPVIPPTDLTTFMPADSTEIEILSPDGVTGTGWMVELAGPSHPNAVAWGNEASKRQLRRQAQLEAQSFNGRKVKIDERDPDDVRRENVGFVVARILGWSPIRIASIQADPITFSADAATKLLMRPDMGWVFSQLVEALGNEKSFTRASAKS